MPVRAGFVLRLVGSEAIETHRNRRLGDRLRLFVQHRPLSLSPCLRMVTMSRPDPAGPRCAGNPDAGFAC